MATRFGTGMAAQDDSYRAGQEAAKTAMAKIGKETPGLSVVFASSKYDYRAVVKGVREITGGAPLIGCSSAGEFTEDAVGSKSVAVAVISGDTHKFWTGMGSSFKENGVKAVQQAYAGMSKPPEDYPYRSGILLIDGLMGIGEEATLAVVEVLGSGLKLAGGAAGDDLQFKQTNVFTDDRVSNNALSMAFVASREPMAIGVKHGHTPVTQKMMLTKAKGSVLYEIDRKPAFQVWKDSLRDFAKKQGVDVDQLNNDSAIGSFLMNYEMGLPIGDDYKIRAPLSVNKDGSINFACTIIENSVAKIMCSSKQAQIDSARKAAENALNAAKGVKLAGAIVFDCVCRGIILGNEFKNSVEAVKQVLGNIPVIGFETYGEIARERGQLSGFHNTTTVVLLIPA